MGFATAQVSQSPGMPGAGMASVPDGVLPSVVPAASYAARTSYPIASNPSVYSLSVANLLPEMHSQEFSASSSFAQQRQQMYMGSGQRFNLPHLGVLTPKGNFL